MPPAATVTNVKGGLLLLSSSFGHLFPKFGASCGPEISCHRRLTLCTEKKMRIGFESLLHLHHLIPCRMQGSFLYDVRKFLFAVFLRLHVCSFSKTANFMLSLEDFVSFLYIPECKFFELFIFLDALYGPPKAPTLANEFAGVPLTFGIFNQQRRRLHSRSRRKTINRKRERKEEELNA